MSWNIRYSRDYDRARSSVRNHGFVGKVYSDRRGNPNFMQGVTIYGKPLGKLRLSSKKRY